MVFILSEMQRTRLEKCRLQYNSFTGSKLEFSEYLAEVLNGAIKTEEACCAESVKLAPCRAHVH